MCCFYPATFIAGWMQPSWGSKIALPVAMGSSAGGEQSAIQPPVKLQLAKRPPSPAGPSPPSEVVPDDTPEEELVTPEEEPVDVPDAEPNGRPEEEPDDAPDGEPDDEPEEEPDDAPDGEPNEEPEVDPLDAPALPPFPEFAPVPAQAPAANKAARRDPPPRESHRLRRNEGSRRTAVIKVSAARIVPHGISSQRRLAANARRSESQTARRPACRRGGGGQAGAWARPMPQPGQRPPRS